MYEDIVFGLLNAATGERDPRNLLMVFSLVNLVGSKLSIGSTLAEELFELPAAYFPIDFIPVSYDG